MKTQEDGQTRTVALENLKAMCDRVSGVCHRYWIEKVTRSRVWVGYSNPDEYGIACPFYVVLPAVSWVPPGTIPSAWIDDRDNPRVFFYPLRFVYAAEEYDPYQSFEPLWSCPKLWRHPETGEWKTSEEIEHARAEAPHA